MVRCAIPAQFAPARNVVRTAVNCVGVALGFLVSDAAAFCQAGVVAPPDSLTGETSSNCSAGGVLV